MSTGTRTTGNESSVAGVLFVGRPALPMNQYAPRKQTNHIVIHCSATKPSMDVGVKEIREWHKQRGWLDVGYHFIIRRDGTVERGRPAKVQGAGVFGHNHDSLHICLVGGVREDDGKTAEENFTKEQWHTLAFLVGNIQEHVYPQADVLGHRDFPGVEKDCPSFDVKTWLAASAPLRAGLVVPHTLEAEA